MIWKMQVSKTLWQRKINASKQSNLGVKKWAEFTLLLCHGSQTLVLEVLLSWSTVYTNPTPLSHFVYTPCFDPCLTPAWPLPDPYLTPTWPHPDPYLTPTWPLSDPYLTPSSLPDLYLIPTWPLPDPYRSLVDPYLTPAYAKISLEISALPFVLK